MGNGVRNRDINSGNFEINFLYCLYLMDIIIVCIDAEGRREEQQQA